MAVKPIPEGFHTVGSTEVKPVEDQFSGVRSGTLKNPFGHVWILGTNLEDVPVEELQKRPAKTMEGRGDCVVDLTPWIAAESS